MQLLNEVVVFGMVHLKNSNKVKEPRFKNGVGYLNMSVLRDIQHFFGLMGLGLFIEQAT